MAQRSNASLPMLPPAVLWEQDTWEIEEVQRQMAACGHDLARTVVPGSASRATALHTAAQDGSPGMARVICRALTATGHADQINALDLRGRTALHAACARPPASNLAVAAVLIEAGASTTAADSDGWTPLHSAADANNTRALQLLLLLATTAQLNAQTNTGATALALAARRGHSHAVSLFLANLADPTIPDKQGLTPLMQAQAAVDARETPVAIASPTLRLLGQAERLRGVAATRELLDAH